MSQSYKHKQNSRHEHISETATSSYRSLLCANVTLAAEQQSVRVDR